MVSRYKLNLSERVRKGGAWEDGNDESLYCMFISIRIGEMQSNEP